MEGEFKEGEAPVMNLGHHAGRGIVQDNNHLPEVLDFLTEHVKFKIGVASDGEP